METAKKAARRMKRGRPSTPEAGYFVFDIQSWQQSYSLSVNHDRDRKGPYREHLGVEIKATCTFPKKIAGRGTAFSIFGERDHLEPEIYKADPKWSPKCIGALRLPPSGGTFYTSLPLDSFVVLVPALIHGLYRHIVLWGPPLSRGVSLCQSLEFAQTVNLSEYG